MIVYKWVIKKHNQYYPIINNGAYKPFLNFQLQSYSKGITIKNAINPNNQLGLVVRQHGFHRDGFHFWKYIDTKQLQQYNKCMKTLANTSINCTLKCFVRNKDIIMQDNQRVIAKKFRILQEI